MCTVYLFSHFQVMAVFRDVCRFWRVQNKCPNKMRRSQSDREPTSPDSVPLLYSPSSIVPFKCGRRWTEMELDEEDENGADSKESIISSSPSEATPFRERASTDGNLFQRPWRWRYAPSSASTSGSQTFYPPAKTERRMSISMRGSNASY